jgi:predicted RNA-binding protein with PUA domain
MGYKMNGFSGFGNKKKSPAKVSDSAVVDAQNKLDHVELDFREPGWATAARGVHEGAKSLMGKFQEGQKAKENMTQEEKDAQATSDEQQGINVQDIVSKTGDLDTDAIQQ